MTHEKLRKILGDVLEIEITADDEVQRSANPVWDSLNHLRVVMAVEEELGVRLEPDEVASIASLVALQRVVERRTILGAGCGGAD
jgi:acyl carrier protein